MASEGFDDGVPLIGPVQIKRGRWTKREKRIFEEGFQKYGKEWKLIASLIQTRTVIQIRTHAQKYFQKLAKATGGPVMSTSKKQKLPESVSGSDSGSEGEEDDILAPLRSRAKARSQMTLRKRVARDMSSDDAESVQIQPKRRRYRESRKDSLDQIAGSGSEDESEDDCISKELAFYNSSFSINTGEGNKPVLGGRVTPRVLAAATLLMAPRFNDSISPKRLSWARNTVASEIF